MKPHSPAVLTLVLLLSPAGLHGADHADRPGDSAWARDLLTWRVDHAKRIDAPDGWLSVVGLDWLQPGNNAFGSAPDNRIRIAGPVPAHLGVLFLGGGTVSLRPPGSGFPGELRLDGRPAAQAQLAVGEHPDELTAGTFSMFVIHRADRFALRVRDSEAPARIHFRGLRWYEPDARYRVRARWVPYTPEKRTRIPTVIGTTIEEAVPGRAEFTLNGRQVSLEPIVEEGTSPRLFFILRDTTSRSTTYGASRFLYTDLPDHGIKQPGSLWLDFNRLENPPCAYTRYATCPLPPQQNRLPVAIPAGEKRYPE